MKKPYLCIYPWKQISVDFTGYFRICCFGREGKIDTNAFHLRKNELSVRDIFNSDFYRDIRKQMLQGEVPRFCQRCKELEDGNIESPREEMLRANPDFETMIAENHCESGATNLLPRSLELVLGNKCNLKCRMCNPYASHNMKNDFKGLGIKFNEKQSDDIFKYWDWDKEIDAALTNLISSEIREIFFLGGEPLLVEAHEKFLEKLIELGLAHKISLRYNTNLMALDLKIMNLWKNFSGVRLSVSIDGTNDWFNYIRYPASWQVFEKNLDFLESNFFDGLEIVFATVYQSYLLFCLPELLDFIWKRSTSLKTAALPHLIVLEAPEALQVKSLPKNLLKPQLERNLKYLEDNRERYFSHSELTKTHYFLLKSFLDRSYKELDQASDGMSFLYFTKRLDQLRSQKFQDLLNSSTI